MTWVGAAKVHRSICNYGGYGGGATQFSNQEVPPVIVDENEVEPLVELPGDENSKTNYSPRSILSRDSESLDDVARKETSSSPKDGKIITAGSGSKRNSITYAVVQSDVNEIQDGGNTATGEWAKIL